MYRSLCSTWPALTPNIVRFITLKAAARRHDGQRQRHREGSSYYKCLTIIARHTGDKIAMNFVRKISVTYQEPHVVVNIAMDVSP